MSGRWHCPWGHRPVPRAVPRDGDKPSASWGHLRKFSPIPKPSKSRGWWGWGQWCRRPRAALGEGRSGEAGSGPCQALRVAMVQRGRQRAWPVGGPPKSPGKRWCAPLPKPQCSMGHPHPGTPILGHTGPPVGTEIPSPAPPAETRCQNQPRSPLAWDTAPGLAPSCHIPAASRGQHPHGRIHSVPEPPQT